MIYFDIETLQCTDADVIEQLKNTIKPPATHKKQAKRRIHSMIPYLSK